MNSRSQLIRELKPLLVALRDGGLQGLAEEQFALCVSLLNSSEEAREVYFDFVAMEAELEFTFSKSPLTITEDSDITTTDRAEDAVRVKVDAEVIRELLDELEVELAEREASDESTSMTTPDPVGEQKPLSREKHTSGNWSHVLPSDNSGSAFVSLPGRIIGFGAAITCLILVALFLRLPKEPNRPIQAVRNQPVVAKLVAATDVHWANESVPVAIGSELRAGKVKLVRGKVRIRFLNGADVSLVAPASLQLIGPGEMFLSFGKLVGYCPADARGFVVAMASSNVVDLGTEFGVKIDEAGVAEVHVLAGKVAVQLGPKSDAIEKQIELTAGSAGRIPPAGRSMQEIRIRADQFAELRPLLDQNLIVNGDFETGAEHGVVVRDENQRTTITDTVISGWDDQTKATKLLYEQPSDGGDFVRPGEHPVPPDHGRFFYIGGEEGTTSQRIDVAQLAEFTDEGVIKCTVSGWLGGFEDQNDTLAMKAIALGDRAEELDTVQLGPVSVTDRGSKTCLLHKFGSMVLPRGTRSVRVELISTSDTTSKFSGNIPDAYCDNLSLVLTRTGGK